MGSARNNRGKHASFVALSVLALSVGLFLASSPSIAEETEAAAKRGVQTSSGSPHIEVGLGGAYKNGFQTQIAVYWDAAAGSPVKVEIEAVDSDGTPFIAADELSEVEKNSCCLKTCMALPKASRKLTVRLIDEKDNAVERVFSPKSKKAVEDDFHFDAPIPAPKPVYLTIGSSDLGFSEAFAELRWKEERRPSIVEIKSIEELPVDFRAYEAFDKVFISTAEAVNFFNYATSASPEVLALERWVERGGSLTILAEEKAIPMLSEGGVLARLAPGTKVEERAQEFRSVNALTSELQNVKNLAMTGSKSKPYLRLPVLSELKADSRVEMKEVETPLLVVRPVGLGTVVFFAADLSVAPLNTWSGRGRLMLKILGLDPDRASAKNVGSGFVKRGYSDLSGQVRSALDRFSGVKIVSFSAVAGLIFAYLLCIAPLDWFIAKKGLKKPNITWVTFPVFAILFCAAGVMLFRTSTPKEPILNQVDMLDVDMASGVVRDSSWFGLYSPIGDRYELNFAPNELNGVDKKYTFAANSAEVDLGPLTLAGDGFGGAEQSTYITRVWDKSYRLSKEGATSKLLDAPLTTRSSKSFFGRWTGVIEGLPKTPNLADDGLSLRGAVVNPFDVPIYSAFIIYKGGAYSLGTLAPGETPIERVMTRLEPTRILNEHRSSVPAAKLKNWDSTTYNSVSTRLPYILRAASFYEFGGGEENFGIENGLQRDVDLSELLRCGRAVVLGTIVDPEFEEYETEDHLSRRSADAIEIANLDRRLAEQRGEKIVNKMEEAIEKYGRSGTSEGFMPTKVGWRSDDSELKPAHKRTVVVRLVVPLS